MDDRKSLSHALILTRRPGSLFLIQNQIARQKGTMHRCLQIQEIVSIIVDFAYAAPRHGLRPNTRTEGEKIYNDYPPRDHDTSTVLSFALTCHAFLEPSLDALWFRQTSLKPLLGCFPPALRDDGFTYVSGSIDIHKTLFHVSMSFSY